MSDEIERAAERIARYLQGAEECCYASEYDPAAKAIWIEPQINGDDICLNLASVAEAALAERSEREREREAFERGFAAGLREGKGNKCAQCNGYGTIQRGYGPARCDACDGKGY